MRAGRGHRQEGRRSSWAASRPNIILDDADLRRRSSTACQKCYLELRADVLGAHPHARSPASWPRSRQIAAETAERTASATRSTRPPSSVRWCPTSQRDRVRGYISQGIEEGAKLVTGGAEAPEGPTRVLRAADGVHRRHTRHDDRPRGDLRPGAGDHALRRRGGRARIANDTHYGLAGGVWSADRSARAASRPPDRNGQIEINGGCAQPAGSVRRLQAVGPRPRVRQVWSCGVPEPEIASAVRGDGSFPPIVAVWQQC